MLSKDVITSSAWPTMDSCSDRKIHSRKCLAPGCQNTTRTSNKLFVNVPIKNREAWLQALNYDKPLSPVNKYVCCEDHFDVERDVQNWTMIKLMGREKVSRVILKKGVIPSRNIGFNAEENEGTSPLSESPFAFLQLDYNMDVELNQLNGDEDNPDDPAPLEESSCDQPNDHPTSDSPLSTKDPLESSVVSPTSDLSKTDKDSQNKDKDLNLDVTPIDDDEEVMKIDQVIGGAEFPSEEIIDIDSDEHDKDEHKETEDAVQTILDKPSDSSNADKKDAESIDLCSDEDEAKKQQPRLKVKSFLTNHTPVNEENKSTDEVFITGENELPLDVIIETNDSPPMKLVDKLEDYQIQLDACAPTLQNCFQCNGYILCVLTMKISDKVFYLCSEQCVKEYRLAEKATKAMWNDKYFQANNAEVIDTPRICQVCSIEINDGSLSWEAMEFCKEDCLKIYQESIGSNCKQCSIAVSPGAFGKYCIRFGGSILQFCAMSCLNTYKNSSKYCFYCQNDLTGESNTVTLPQSYYREFCNDDCLQNLQNILNKPKSKVTVANCAVCAKTKLAAVEVISDTDPVALCSDICMSAYKFRNRMKVGHCFMCKKYYDKNLIKELVIFQDGQPSSYCSLSCMNINILSRRDIVPCCLCKAKKYNFDMIIYKTFVSNNLNADLPLVEVVNYLCSLNCYSSYIVRTTGKQKQNCAQCKKEAVCTFTLSGKQGELSFFCSNICVAAYSKLSNGTTPVTTSILQDNLIKVTGPPPLVSKPKLGTKTVTKSVNSISTQVMKNQMANILVKPREYVDVCNKMTMISSPIVQTANKTVSVHPVTNQRGTQTEEKNRLSGLIPVPVPIYVPCPMAMYSIPTPTLLPVPVPVPIPIFIPTTKNNYKDILEEINRIVEKTPREPIEAELLIMAEMVAEEKDMPNTQESSTFMADEVMESSNSFGDDMLQMALKMASDLEETPDLETLDENERKRRCDVSIETSKRRKISEDYEKPDSNMSLKFTLGVNSWKFFSKQWNKEIESGKEGRPVKTDLLSMTSAELGASLSLFLKEAKMASGDEYKPDVKFYLMLGIQYYLSESGRVDNIFCDSIYTKFIDAFDEEAIKFQTMYPNPEDAAISRVEEEHLWESKHVGAHSPYSLLVALIYFNTKLFNLTTVEEHLQLSFSTVSKQWKRNMDSTPPHGGRQSTECKSYYLKFTPTQLAMEMNPRMKRIFEQQENKENPYRCPVKLYNFYISKCPASVTERSDLFYLEPERSGVAHSPCWYSNQALSEKTIRNILNRVKMIKQVNQALQTDKFL